MLFSNQFSRGFFAFVCVLFFAAESFAAVTPGKEQDTFEAQAQSKSQSEELQKTSKQISVQFAQSIEEARQMASADEEEDEAPKRSSDEDDEQSSYAPSTGKSFVSDSEKIVIPIAGRIDVNTLRALAEALKNIDEDEGSVEVSIAIEINKRPGSYSLESNSSVNPLAATYQFEQPANPMSPESRAMQRDLKKAEKNAAKQDIQSLGEEVSFVVEKVELEGNSIISTDELKSVYEPWQTKSIKLSDAKAIADKITGIYRERGYITCRAYIPPQAIETKVLKIQILEGTLGKVKIRGNKYFKKRVLKRYLAPLRGQVLQYKDLQKQLTRLNLHPDREVKAILVPGEVVGTSDLLLEVKDQMPIHVNAEVNNFGTELTGQERYGIGVRHNNLLGQDDILATRLQLGEEVIGISAQHVLPVGPYGTQAGWTLGYTDVNVGGQFSALDIGGQALTGSLFANHPLRDGDKLDITWTGSFESKSIDNTLLGTTTSEDELRMFHTGANLDIIDPYGRTFITNDFTFGTPWLGASDKHDARLSRLNSGASFLIYNGALNRIHPVYDQTYLYLKGALQAGPDPLVSAEQFDLGGIYSVRGYPQSDYLGDYGTSGTAEIRIPWYFIPKDVKAPYSDEALWNKIHFVGFIDGGYAALKRPAVGEHPSRSYVGLGGGLRFDLPNNFQARFEYAAPVGDDPVDGSNGQFYFTISSDLV